MKSKETIKTVRQQIIEQVSLLVKNTEDAGDLYRLAETLATLNVLEQE